MNTYFISKIAHECVVHYLSGKGNVIKLDEHPSIEGPVSTHPDLQLVLIKDQMVFAPNADPQILAYMMAKRIPFHIGKSNIHSPYPGHVPYNCVVLEQYLLHNLKVIDGQVLQIAEALGLRPIHIQQGYSKCSTVVVDGCSIITSDLGIKKAISNLEIDCLMVEEGFVSLDPFSHGFIGGASGRVEDALVWNGSLDDHPDQDAIRGFVQSKGIKNIEFEGYPLIDIGSIIEWKVD